MEMDDAKNDGRKENSRKIRKKHAKIRQKKKSLFNHNVFLKLNVESIQNDTANYSATDK